MNKIFKVIFNKSLGRMVIVSENAKSQGKAKSTQNTKNQSVASKIKVIKPLIVISSLFLSPYVFAANNIVQGISCVPNAASEWGPFVYKLDGVGYSFALGAQLSSAVDSFADNAIVMGTDCSNNTVALSNGIAMGSGAAASEFGIAMGTNALAQRAYNVAIGSQAQAKGINSVALGANSVADRANTFSVGSATNLRQITSVAAGTENTDAVNLGQVNSLINNITVGENYAHSDFSATAIGSASGQPFITKNNGTVLTEVAGVRVTATGLNIDNISSFFITDGSNNVIEIIDPDKVLAFKHTAKNGANIAVGKYSVAFGSHNIASGNSSSAVGNRNTASGAYSSAVGTLNKSIGIGSSAIGSGLKQHGGETYTFGLKTLSFDNFTITTNLPNNESTFTSSSNFTPDIITSINGVTNLSDAAKQAFISYVKGSSSGDKINQATGIASSALGVVNNAVGLGSSAVGFNNNATGDASAAYGASTSALAQYSSVFGSYSQATAEKATAVGYNSVADRANTISVGKSGAEKQITNVATGSQSTDAVNKKQMDDSVGVVDSRITTEVGTLDGKITANSNAITGLDGRVTTEVGTLNTQIGTEVTTLDGRITSEVGALDGKITTNSNAISGLDGRVTTEVGTLNTRIGTEVTTLDGRITSEVGTLDGKITTNSTAISGLDGRVTTNEGDIANLKSGQGTLNQLAVQYDTTTQDVITLKGTSGTKITNLQNGDISTVNSKDAVTGGQLYTTNTAISTLDGRVTTEVGTLNTRIGTEVGTLNTRMTSEVDTLDGKITTNSNAINTLGGRVTTNEGDIANLKSGQGTLNQLAVQYDTTTQDIITLKGTSGTKITNLQNGDISTVNSKDAVTGGQLYTTNTAISTLDGRVTTEIGTLNTRIGTEVTTLDGRITSEIGTLDGKITTNSTAISGLDGRVTTNEGDIANLQQGQGTLNQLAVQYDSATQDVITLKGTNGTTLTNLKAGDISTVNSKDAVTGGQLYTTNQNVTMLSTQATAGAQQITSILGGGASYSRGVFTLPTFSIQGKSYSNIGDTFGAVNTEISSLKTSVTNLKAYVDQQNSGSESNLKSYIDQQDSKNLTDAKNYTDQQASNTLNSANTYTDQQASTTLDSANQYSDQQAATALKNANAYTDRKVTGINTGTGNTKGTGLNSTAIGPNTVVSGNNSTAVGVGNNVSGNNSGAFGDPNIVTANGSYVVGNDNTVSGDNTFVLGSNVSTSAKNSVVLGNDSTSTRDNTVSVGSSGNERQITNVADATQKTDAVNLRQMQAANTETLKSSKEYTDTRISTLESSFSDFSDQTDRRFKEVDKRFDRQGAMSAAMMNMATSTAGLKGLNRVGVAAGFQGDEKAVAIGYQRIVSENVSLSVGGAFTDEDGSGGAGVGFSW